MNKTKIEWTDMSVNPIRAIDHQLKNQRSPGHYCEKVSGGCANCYASRMQSRFQMPTFGGSTALTGSKDRALSNARPKRGGVMVNDHIEVYLDTDVLRKVLAHKKPARIFWCDMTDLFGWWVPDEWIDKCFAVMAMTPHLTHQVLTKRAERMFEYMAHHEINKAWSPNRKSTDESFKWKTPCDAVYTIARELRGRDAAPALIWPLPNVWLGVSVEDQKAADQSIPWLLKTPAAVRFLSVEPLLGTIDLSAFIGGEYATPYGSEPHYNAGLHWVIVGGESGLAARPMHPDWARSIRHQCVVAGVPFFFKQWGEFRPRLVSIAGSPQPIATDGKWGTLNAAGKWLPQTTPWNGREDGDSDDQHEVVVIRVGKKAAGRLLDGRTWDEIPESAK